MRMQVNYKILTAVIGGLMGLSQGMIFEPIRSCLESAKVDSIQEWNWMDTTMSTPPPYRSLYTSVYLPGTCILASDYFLGYWMDMPNRGTYILRPGTLIVDYTVNLEDGTRLTGATYYAAAGTQDSTEFYETVKDSSTGKNVVQTTRTRSFVKPGYDLVQVRIRMGSGPWILDEQDSIVRNGTGSIIYSTGRMNAVTTCVSDGKTYACTPVGTSPAEDLQKQVWFMTGDRADSVRYYNLAGVLLETDKWFWSAKSSTKIATEARLSSPRMADPGTLFDVAGRKFPESDRVQRRFKLVGAREK
jgi:hypothetical protein